MISELGHCDNQIRTIALKLEARAEMPVMPDAAVFATGEHDQAD
jgi:hypothetical protein